MFLLTSSRKQFQPILTKSAVGVYMAIQGLTGDAKLDTEIANLRFGLSHSCLGEAKLGRGHLRLAPAVAASGSC